MIPILKSRHLAQIDDWRTRALIDMETAERLRTDIEARAPSFQLTRMLTIIGSVALCFGAISFVAANWDEMGKLPKLVVLFTAMWSAYIAAIYAQNRGQPAFREAMVLLGCGLFGANIMLVAQIFNIAGNGTSAVALWGSGSLLAAIALRSAPAAVLGLGLFSLWMVWRTSELHHAEPWFAVPLVVSIYAFWRIGWERAFDLVAIATVAWLVTFGIWERDYHFELIIALGAGIMAFALFAAHSQVLPVWTQPDRVAVYAFALFAIGAFGYQFIDGSARDLSWGLAALCLAAFVATSVVAGLLENRGLLAAALTAVSLQLLMIYAVKIGNLMNTSAFFVSVGILMLLIGYMAQRLYHRFDTAQGVTS